MAPMIKIMAQLLPRLAIGVLLSAQVIASFSAQPCKVGVVEQLWKLSPGVSPGDSRTTNVQMAAPKGGCWEITACDTADGASVGCGYGCKPLPVTCKSACACNGAWASNKNGTLTSVMDGKCLQLSDVSVVTVAACTTGKPNQQFSFAKSGDSFTVHTHNGLCITGATPPAPPPTPCAKLSTAAACAAAVDKHGKSRCDWNHTTGHCQQPPPPPPPQPCGEITEQVDCRWSNSPALPKGRDCRWAQGKCGPVALAIGETVILLTPPPLLPY